MSQTWSQRRVLWTTHAVLGSHLDEDVGWSDRAVTQRRNLTYAATTKPKPVVGLLYCSTFVADAIAALLGSRVRRRGEVVRGSGLGVDGGHLDEL